MAPKKDAADGDVADESEDGGDDGGNDSDEHDDDDGDDDDNGDENRTRERDAAAAAAPNEQHEPIPKTVSSSESCAGSSASADDAHGADVDNDDPADNDPANQHDNDNNNDNDDSHSNCNSNTNSYCHNGKPDPIDERDADEPRCHTAYVREMYQHFRTEESLAAATCKYQYMNKNQQPQLTARMSSILVDWLVEVHTKFKLVPETLYLAVNAVDRYLTTEDGKGVLRSKLQLVGAAALWTVSKYEEIYPIELRDAVYICDRAYSKEEVRTCYCLRRYYNVHIMCAFGVSNSNYPFLSSHMLQFIAMEQRMLTSLNYRLTVPSAHSFLVRYLKAAHADKSIVQLSCYILDGTLLSYDLLRFRPSQLTAAAVFVARKTVGRNPWSPTLGEYADYDHHEAADVARVVLKDRDAPHLNLESTAIRKKYANIRYGSVANTQLLCDF